MRIRFVDFEQTSTASLPQVLRIRTARGACAVLVRGNTTISRMASCSAHASVILGARRFRRVGAPRGEGRVVLPPASAADEPPAVPDVSAGTVCEPASVSLEVSSSSTKPPARYPGASPVAAAAARRWRTAPCSLGRSPATVSRRCTDAAGIPGAIAPCDEFLPSSSGTSNRKQVRGARPPVTAVLNTPHRRRTGPGPSERGAG